MTREQALVAIASWNPDAGDLSDEVARWIAEDDAVREAFDARFEPAPAVQPIPVPGGQLERYLEGAVSAPPRIPWVAMGSVLAIAATATLVVLSTVGTNMDATFNSVATATRAAGGPVYATPEREGQVASQPAPAPAPVPAGPRASASRTPSARRVNEDRERRRQEELARLRSQREGRAAPVRGEDAPDGFMGMPEDLFFDAPAPKPRSGTGTGGTDEVAALTWEAHPGRYGTVVDKPTHGRVQVSSNKIDVVERIYFEDESTELAPTAEPVVDAVAEVLLANPSVAIEIGGHTDGKEAGLRLSDARAESVRRALIERGVAGDRLVPVGYGSTQPLAAGDLARNRRTEFRLLTDRAPVPASVEAPSGEDYTDYGHRDFVRTAVDPLSTFSVDVDTASYSVTRRKLEQGFLPPAAAVRVEEFVNHFPYDYVPPRDEPFAVHFEAAPSAFNPRTHLVRIGIQGKKVPADARKPAHLVFLVDTSGSMQTPDKLGLVKQSLTMLTRELRDGDTVAIVAYAGSAGVILEPTPISNRAAIVAAIARLEANGSTAMGQGIELAYTLAERNLSQGAVNRVIIASDGDANVGAAHHSELSALIRDRADKGITLTTLGFGEGNYKDTTMEQIADDGDGNYYYIDSEQQARRILVDRLTSTLQVIARDVKIQVEWSPSVLAYRLVGYENRDIADVDFRNDAVDAGEVGAGHQVTALYEVALAADPTPEIATVRMRYKAPGPDAPSVERSHTMGLESVRHAFNESTRDFQIAVAASSFAEVLRDSPHVHGASFGQVAAIARGAIRPEYDEDAELLRLIETADRLSGR